MFVMRAPPMCELRTSERTEMNVMKCLQAKNYISHWDLDATQWLRTLLTSLVNKDFIKPIDSDYPLLKWDITIKGYCEISRILNNGSKEKHILTTEEKDKIRIFTEELVSNRTASSS